MNTIIEFLYELMYFALLAIARILSVMFVIDFLFLSFAVSLAALKYIFS